MVCQGGVWKAVLGFNGSGQVTVIGNQLRHRAGVEI
jgi:hypothetical protein